MSVSKWLGATVRLKPDVKYLSGPRGTAVVEHYDPASGAIRLDGAIGGFQWWNRSDLVIVKAAERNQW